MQSRSLARGALRRAREAGRLAVARVDPHARIGWPDERPDHVERLLTGAGIPVRRWPLPAAGFAEYLERAVYPEGYHGSPSGRRRSFYEKALEHFVSLELASPAAGEVLVDVASNGGPFIGIASALHGVGCFEQDLRFPAGTHGSRIGGDAAHMTVEPGFADVMTLHCSYDHFEGTSDVGFAREAARVMRPGGRTVIVPLYLSDTFGAKVDPRLRLPGLRLDEGMLRFWIPGLGVRFSRFYDPERLKSRVLEPAAGAGLSWEVVRITGVAGAVADGYCHFGLVLRKPAQ